MQILFVNVIICTETFVECPKKGKVGIIGKYFDHLPGFIETVLFCRRGVI
jgi:hypothetical protein